MLKYLLNDLFNNILLEKQLFDLFLQIFFIYYRCFKNTFIGFLALLAHVIFNFCVQVLISTIIIRCMFYKIKSYIRKFKKQFL